MTGIFCSHEIMGGPRKLLTIPLLSFLFFGHACRCKAGQMVTNAFSVSWLRPYAYRRGAGRVKMIGVKKERAIHVLEQTAVSSCLYLVTGKSRQSSQTLFCLSKPGHLLNVQEKYVGFVTCHCTGNSETVHLFYCLPKVVHFCAMRSSIIRYILNSMLHLGQRTKLWENFKNCRFFMILQIWCLQWYW